VSSNANSAASKFKYNGKELNEELGLNWYDYGARNYDAALGRWMNIDPLAEAYVSTSPFIYAINNPIFFIDPDGMRIDVSSILEQDDDGNYVNSEIAEAFLAFASSEVGIEFLSKFAEKGQVIAGHEYTESGEFDKQGLDLEFKAENLNYAKGEGSTTRGVIGPNGNFRFKDGKRKAEKDGAGTMLVRINTELNSNNSDAKNYSDNKDDPMARNLYILSRIGTIFHEVIIHANSYAEDLTDDCKIDGNGTSQHVEAKKPGSLFLKKVLPVMINMHREKKTKQSEGDIKKRVLNFQN